MAFGESVKERGIRKGLAEEVLSGSTKDADAKKPIFCLAVLRALAGLVSGIKSRLGDSESHDDCAWGGAERRNLSEPAIGLQTLLGRIIVRILLNSDRRP